MLDAIIPDFSFDTEKMNHRVIKISIGQISGDEPGKDDQEFNITLMFTGKNASRFIDRVLLDFKNKRTDKYHKIYRNQLSVILFLAFSNKDICFCISNIRINYWDSLKLKCINLSSNSLSGGSNG